MTQENELQPKDQTLVDQVDSIDTLNDEVSIPETEDASINLDATKLEDQGTITNARIEGSNESATVDEPLEEVDVEIQAAPDYTAGPSLVAAIDQAKFQRLTKKNQQYLIAVDKNLSSQPLEQSTYRAVIGELADTLIQGQKTGQTARHLYGTPTECAQVIRDQHFPTQTNHEPTTPSEAWQLGLDGALLLGSIYILMTGLTMLNNQNTGLINGIGLITLIVNYIVAGFAMLLIARNLPKPEAPKGQKGYAKYFAMSTLAMLSWVGAVSLTTAFLPAIINPILPPIALIVIGGITLAARFYVKKKLNIRGGIF